MGRNVGPTALGCGWEAELESEGGSSADKGAGPHTVVVHVNQQLRHLCLRHSQSSWLKKKREREREREGDFLKEKKGKRKRKRSSQSEK